MNEEQGSRRNDKKRRRRGGEGEEEGGGMMIAVRRKGWSRAWNIMAKNSVPRLEGVLLESTSVPPLYRLCSAI
jgi:hypothetical protein